MRSAAPVLPPHTVAGLLQFPNRSFLALAVLFTVLGTSQLIDIVSNSYDIFARWERMCGTYLRHEVSKSGGDEHGKQYTRGHS